MTTHPDRDTATTLTKAERTAVHRAETEFLVVCGACDGGLPMGCVCPTADYRATMLTLVETVARLAAQPPQDDPQPWPCDNYRAPVTCLTAPSSEARRCDRCMQDDSQPDERKAELHGPGWFWTRTEWAEWSNKLAMLFTEDEAHGNPDGAQESVIFDTFAAWAEERRHHPDTGLRERVEAVLWEWEAGGPHGTSCRHAARLRAALAEPTPGTES